MSTPTVHRLGELKTAAWQAIRHANVTSKAADYDAALAAMKATEAACEQYRVAHHPEASEVFVLADFELGQPVAVYARFNGDLALVGETERATS